MELSSIARIVREKAELFDDRDLALCAQAIETHTISTHERSTLRLFSVPDVAELLGVSRRYAWTLVHQGKIRSVRMGKRRAVRMSDIAHYIENLTGSTLLDERDGL